VAKLKRKRAYVNPNSISEWEDKAADYISKGISPAQEIENRKAADEKIKVRAADYADSRRDNPLKSLDKETKEYVLKYKDATIEPQSSTKPQNERQEPEQPTDPTKVPVVIVPPPTFGGGGSGSGGGNKYNPNWKFTSGSGSSGSGSGGGNKGGGGSSTTGSSPPILVVDIDRLPPKDKIPPDDQDELLKPLPISDGQADMYARLCGSTDSIKVLRAEYQDLKRRMSRIENDREVAGADKRENMKKLAEMETEISNIESDLDAEKKKLNYNAANADKDAKSKMQENIDILSRKASRRRADYYQLRDDISRTGTEHRLDQSDAKLNRQYDLLKDKFTAYYAAVSCGQEKYKKEHGWRTEWAKPVGENVSNMLNPVSINDPSGIVNYGGMTGRSAVEGMNAITGGYKVRDEANSWTRTSVGDRQLVESLVNVRPNRVITPFGVPGTVGESNLSNQFQYSSPLRKIGVGDVTARGGYQINIEDIHRNKRNTEPALIRKRLAAKKLAKQRKLAEQKRIAEQELKAQKVKIKSSMSVNNPAIANAAGFLRVMNSPVMGMRNVNTGISHIKGISSKPSSKGVSSLKVNSESSLKVNSENSIKGLATLGKIKGLAVGNFDMKGVKRLTENAVELTLKKKKVSK